MVRVSLSFVATLVLIGACTQIRYTLAPKKGEAINGHFASPESSREFFQAFVEATVDVVAGLPSRVVEEAATTGRPVPMTEGIIASGTLIESGRYVLTAAHVVQHGGPYFVSGRGSSDGVLRPAALVWCSTAADLAALKPNQAYDYAVEWSDDVKIGEAVFLIGLWGEHSVGAVAALDEIAPGVTAVTHSAQIRGGDSGGPLLTRSGRLIGINTKINFGLIRYKYTEARRVDAMGSGNDCFDGW